MKAVIKFFKTFFLAVGLSLYRFVINLIISALIFLGICGITNVIYMFRNNLPFAVSIAVIVFVFSFHEGWMEAKGKIK